MAFGQYRTITIDHTKVPSTQTNFTVLVTGTLSYLATIANAGKIANTVAVNLVTVPADLKFTSDIAGTTLLNWEVSAYNATTGLIEIWVLISSLSSSVDTVIYMFYGDSSTTTFQGGAIGTAWDSSYIILYHLGDGTTLIKRDSGLNGYTLSQDGSPAAATGINGIGAVGLTASNSDDLVRTSIAELTTAARTTACWVKANSFPGAYNTIISTVNNDATPCGFDIHVKSNGKLACYITCTTGSATKSYDGTGTTLSTGIWYYLVLTYDSSAGLIGYINGSVDGTATPAGTILAGSALTFNLGNNKPNVSTRFFDGLIDEARVSSVARSANWITTNYNNQLNPGTFSTIGSETSLTTTVTETLTDTIALTDAQLLILNDLITFSDTITFTDAVTLLLGNPFLTLTLSDTLALTDNLDFTVSNPSQCQFTTMSVKLKIANFFQNPSYYKDIDLTDSIQDGVDEIVAFTGCNYGTAVIPFVANLSYYDFLTLIPDYVGVIAIYNTTTRLWMTPLSLGKLDLILPDWEISIGTPEYFCPINHRYVVIHRKPGAANYGNMYVLYRASAPTLGDNINIPVPLEYSQLVESYMKMDLWEQNEEFTKAGKEFGTYQQQLEKLHNLVHSKRQMDRLPSL